MNGEAVFGNAGDSTHAQSADVRLLADENFRQKIVDELRRKVPEVDVMTAADAGILGLKDPLVLAFAAQSERVLLTHDVQTMPGHLDDLLAGGHHSPGIILVPQTMTIGRALADLVLVVKASTPDDWRDLFTRLPL